MHTKLPRVAKPGKSSRFRLWITALFFIALCSTAPTVWAQVETGLHFTPAEVAVWRQRASATALSGTQNYRVPGDVQAGSPGDWARIEANAKFFLSNPSAKRYKCEAPGYNSLATGCVPAMPNGLLDPLDNHITLKDAAFASLILRYSKPDTALLYRNAVLNELIEQANEGRVSFTGDRWSATCNEYHDLSKNPFFQISEWLTRLVFAYDYIKPYLTVEQAAEAKAKIEPWFKNAGDYFKGGIDYQLTAFFPNRMKTDSTKYVPSTLCNNREHTNANHLSWYGGHKVGALARNTYTNRWGSIASFISLVGIQQNKDTFKVVGKMFYKEWLMFGVYSDNTPAEFERWDPSEPSRGLGYASSTTTQAGFLANHFARIGDFELYNFSTSDGYGDSQIPVNSNSTAGGSKNLRSVMRRMMDVYNGTFKQNNYVIASTEDSTNATIASYFITGFQPSSGRFSIVDTWFASCNQYYKDDYILDTYTRKINNPLNGNAPRPYPMPPATTGLNSPYMGVGAIYPGVLFMFGQMENSQANPYRLKIASPANNATFTSGTAIPLTVDASKVYALSGVEYYKDGEATPFLTSTTAPYNLIWSGALAGTHTIKGKPISASTPTTIMPFSEAITITVTGSIAREHWNVGGSTIASIPVGTPPAYVSSMPSFEGPPNNPAIWGIGDNYGARYRGYLIAPETGLYTFWIKCDNEGEFWLSTDTSKANKTKKAFLYDAASYFYWEQYPSQKSSTISLTAGQKYYVEALHKESTGGDILQIGWRRPTAAANSTPEVIPGMYLAPYFSSPTGGARTSAENLAENTSPRMNVFPNPSMGKVFVHFTTTATEYASVNMYNMWGGLVHPLFAGKVEAGEEKRIEMDVSQFATGMYVIRLVTPNKVDFKKIILMK